MSTKVKTSFFCQNCGAPFSKWQGQCFSCKEWNTIVEEVIEKPENLPWKKAGNKVGQEQVSKPELISTIDSENDFRFNTNDIELNRVLGGGLVAGSVSLLGGEPGIGKSTLLLQIALKFPYKTLYVSGEESSNQIKMRSDRIAIKSKTCYILTETKTNRIFSHIEKLIPELIIIDSIQTLESPSIDSAAGSVSQIKECTSELIKYAKSTNTPVILIGHITKDGAIAGPKILEHMVDVVLHFEGDKQHLYRILRTLKNRFGSTSEIGIFQMEGHGLRTVENPSELLISSKEVNLSGSSVGCTIEGLRPLLIEVQALVSTAVYGTPQRSSTGFNVRRLNLILAVLEKRVGFKLASKDVFLNITGGIHTEDTAIDLAVVASILSSNEDIEISNQVCFSAEVGLSGEIRAVSQIEKRILEAEKLGYQSIYISKYNKINPTNYQIEVIKIGKIEQLVTYLFA